MSLCSTCTPNNYVIFLNNRYAHENGCEWGYKTTEEAATNGHTECLKYVNGFYCSVFSSVFCIFNKRYAYENGCPYSPYITQQAAMSTSLECLKYARSSMLSQHLIIHCFFIVNIIHQWLELFGVTMCSCTCIIVVGKRIINICWRMDMHCQFWIKLRLHCGPLPPALVCWRTTPHPELGTILRMMLWQCKIITMQW
jgi:hypothetical protein